MQPVEPAWEKWPFGHAVHAVRAAFGWKKPPAHFVHDVAPFREYLPAGQSGHEPCPDEPCARPARQSWHPDAFADDSLPGLQIAHDVAPGVAYLPAVHALQPTE